MRIFLLILQMFKNYINLEDSLQLYLLVEVTYGTSAILHFAKDLP